MIIKISLFVLAFLFTVQAYSLDKYYVANEGDGTISVVSMQSAKVIKTIDTMEMTNGSHTEFSPHNVQVSPDQKTVWLTAPVKSGGHGGSQHNSHNSTVVTNEHSEHGTSEVVIPEEQVIVIDTANDKIIKRIKLGSHLHLAHVVFDEAGEFAYVSANEANKLFKIHANNYQVSKSIPLSLHGPHGMRICRDKIFLAAMEGQGLILVDLATEIQKNIDLGGIAVQTACSENAQDAFVSLYDTKEIIHYDVDQDLLQRIALPNDAQGPVQIRLSVDEKLLYVADQGMLLGRPVSNKLYTIELATHLVTSTTLVGQGAHGVEVSEDGQWILVTNQAEGTVSMINAHTMFTEKTISVGSMPNGISIK